LGFEAPTFGCPALLCRLELTAETDSPQSLCLARDRQSSLVLLETVEARLYLAARVVMDVARGKGL
jgi:hypothetical protein